MSGTLKAYKCGKPWHPYPCWHTKCTDCGEVITCFDFTEEESLRLAQDHECTAAPKPEQLTIPA